MITIYFIGWLVTIVLGFMWYLYYEKEHPEYDYHLVGLIIIIFSLLWPISIPILIIRYLINK